MKIYKSSEISQSANFEKKETFQKLIESFHLQIFEMLPFLKSLLRFQTLTGPPQTANTKIFAAIVNYQKQSAIVAKLSILDVCVSGGDASDLLMRKLMKKMICLPRKLHEYEK